MADRQGGRWISAHEETGLQVLHEGRIGTKSEKWPATERAPGGGRLAPRLADGATADWCTGIRVKKITWQLIRESPLAYDAVGQRYPEMKE